MNKKVNELREKLLDENIWKDNDKQNIKLYIADQLRRYLENIYWEGFEEGEKIDNLNER